MDELCYGAILVEAYNGFINLHGIVNAMFLYEDKLIASCYYTSSQPYDNVYLASCINQDVQLEYILLFP